MDSMYILDLLLFLTHYAMKGVFWFIRLRGSGRFNLFPHVRT